MAVNRVVAGLQNNPDGQPFVSRGAKTGEQIVSELHGKYAEAGLRGQIFIATTVIAGVALPTAAATLNSKFTLWNPAGSGVNVELISFSQGLDTATQVVNGVGLLIQRNLTGTSGIPTSLTLITPQPLGIPAGASRCSAASQATLTNVAIPGVTAATAVPIPFYHCFSMGATTAAGVHSATHDFDGKIWLAPDTLVAGCATVAPVAANFTQIVWAEWQV